MFSMRNDRMTLNVAGTALSESGSAVDVLQKAARVKVDESGISVLGVGNALILVDGRELPTNQALEMLSSSEIQKVDIITNPSSKYDAKGKAVIEIRTKKARNQGFGAEVTGRMSKGENFRNSNHTANSFQPELFDGNSLLYLPIISHRNEPDKCF